MLRLARSRGGDPCHCADPRLANWCGYDSPSLDVEYADLPVADFVSQLPSYKDRQKLLARNPLACADGFRILCRLVFRDLFGVRACANCPDCNMSRGPCQDIFGSNASPEGGVYGRADACIGSCENQKSGALHLHGQLFVQCIHQLTPLKEIMAKIRAGRRDIVEGSLAYNAHVCKQTYDEREGWEREDGSGRRLEREEKWPEYEDVALMLSRPAYQRHQPNIHVLSPEVPRSVLVEDGEAWSESFNGDVQLLQEHKQHHVHIPDQDGVRQPLTHCRREDDPRPPLAKLGPTSESA